MYLATFIVVTGPGEPPDGARGRRLDLEDVVKWNVRVVAGQPLQPGFEGFRKVWGQWPDPPAITVAIAIGLARREFLVEMDAVAVVAE